jgi:hypothetical protein
MIRAKVADILSRGTIPSETDGEEAEFSWLEDALNSLELPLTNEEAAALAAVFGEDNYFGLAWTLLHAIETSPDPVYASDPGPSANEWQRRSWERARRSPGMP